jgi:hypothetical protein
MRVLGTEIVSKKESFAREHVFARGKTPSFLTPGACVTRSVLTFAHDLSTHYTGAIKSRDYDRGSLPPASTTAYSS